MICNRFYILDGIMLTWLKYLPYRTCEYLAVEKREIQAKLVGFGDISEYLSGFQDLTQSGDPALSGRRMENISRPRERSNAVVLCGPREQSHEPGLTT